MLTTAGERQARAVASRLSSERLDLVQTSPRERAHGTADAIAARAGAPLEVVDALDEIDFGDWTGCDYAQLEHDPAWRDWNERRGDARCPRGESMAEAADRIHSHVERLARERPGQRIALVSHADMLRGLVARTLGLPLGRLLGFEIEPASVSRIEAGSWGGRVLSLNGTTHLNGLGGAAGAEGA